MLDPALAAIAMIVRAVAAVVTVGIAIALAIEYIIAFTMEEITHIERRPQSESGRDATRPFDGALAAFGYRPPAIPRGEEWYCFEHWPDRER